MMITRHLAYRNCRGFDDSQHVAGLRGRERESFSPENVKLLENQFLGYWDHGA